MAIRIGIYGYGNLGKGVEAAITQNPDLTAVGVFTKRDPATVQTRSGIPVYSAEKALEMTGADKLVLAGGVAANSHIRRALGDMCERRGAKLYMPRLSLCGDNAAMVAMAGYFEYLKGNFADTYLNASANDEI